MNRKTSILTRLGVSAAVIAAAIWFLYNYFRNFGFGHGNWFMPHHMMAGNSGMGLVIILFWGVAGAAIVLLVSGLITGHCFSNGTEQNPVPDALEILKQRYASGQIGKSQYEGMRRDLQ